MQAIRIPEYKDFISEKELADLPKGDGKVHTTVTPKGSTGAAASPEGESKKRAPEPTAEEKAKISESLANKKSRGGKN